jgi:hypothetical protein
MTSVCDRHGITIGRSRKEWSQGKGTDSGSIGYGLSCTVKIDIEMAEFAVVHVKERVR